MIKTEEYMKRLAIDDHMMDALSQVFRKAIDDEIIARVHEGKEVVGFKEANEIVQRTLRSLATTYAPPEPKKEVINQAK